MLLHYIRGALEQVQVKSCITSIHEQTAILSSHSMPTKMTHLKILLPYFYDLSLNPSLVCTYPYYVQLGYSSLFNYSSCVSVLFVLFPAGRALLLLPPGLRGDGTEEGASGWTPGPVPALQSNQ